MAKWTVFLVTVILVTAVGVLLIWYFIDGQSINHGVMMSSEQNQILHAEKSTIWFINNDFTPLVLNIEAGKMVTWINLDDQPIKIVSNYPKSRYLPELVSNTLDKGESFSFSFTVPGEWKYHNFFDKTKEGKIVIR